MGYDPISGDLTSNGVYLGTTNQPKATSSSGQSPTSIDQTNGVSYNETQRAIDQSTKEYWEQTGMAMAGATVTQDTKDYWEKTGTSMMSTGNTGATDDGSSAGGSGSGSGTTTPAAPVDTRTQAEREADFYKALTDAKTAAANGNPKPLQDFDAFFKITRNPDEYKKAFYADYSSAKLNAATEQEIKRWFLDRDANNDGLVSLDEMGENARRINESLVGADGKLSVAEGIKYHEGRVDSIDGKLAISGLPQETQDEIRNWHMERDLNKDGSIQQSEITANAWNAQFDGVRDDGKITVEESINRHRILQGMKPIDWSTVNSGDIAPVATGELSPAERLAMASSTVAPKTPEKPVAPVAVPEASVVAPEPVTPETTPGTSSGTLDDKGNPTIYRTQQPQQQEEQITQQETMMLKDFHIKMEELGLGFNADGSVDFSGARGQDPDEVAALHRDYDRLSATEKQILAATWDAEFDTSSVSEEVKAVANSINASENGDGASGLDEGPGASDEARSEEGFGERGNSEDRELVVGNETAAEAGSDANRHTKTVRTGGELDIEHPENTSGRESLDWSNRGTQPAPYVNNSDGETLAAQGVGAQDKVYVAKGGSVTKMIQDIAAESGQQISGKEAWKIYESMKEDLAKMDNTYTMQNGHVGLSKPGEMRVDSSIVSKIRDLSSGEGALQAARIDGANTMPSALGQESSSMGLAGSTHVKNNSAGASGLPSMP